MSEPTRDLLTFLAIFAWIFGSIFIPFYLYGWLRKKLVDED